MTDEPLWLREANAAHQRGEAAKARYADERAMWVAKGVAEHGRGGREYAAGRLGVTVGMVDRMLARARSLDRPSALPAPDELLERLYALELADMPPLPADWWHVLRHIAQTTAMDAAWLDHPGELLAQEVEDIDPDELPAGVEQAALVQTCRAWGRLQALAVLDAASRPSDVA